MSEASIPLPTPETAHFWAGTAAGELRLQRCRACEKSYFPPRPFCPACGGRDVAVETASGRGRLHTFTISHFDAPGYEAPYVIAVVELEEGPRMMSNVIDCPPEPDALEIDMPLTVTFRQVSNEIWLPQFRPARHDAGEGAR